MRSSRSQGRPASLTGSGPWVNEADASAFDPRESSEVLGVDAERHAGAGLRTQRLHYCVARRPENLNLRRCVVASSVSA
jgi:hypothetical protein